MVVGVEVGEVVAVVVEDDQYTVVVAELSEVVAPLFIVDASHIGVVPHLASAQSGVAAALERDAVNGLLGEDIASCRTVLDKYFGEILFEEYISLLLGCTVGFERYLYHFGLAVGVGSEVHDARTLGALGQVVLAVTSTAVDEETLDEAHALAAVAIDHVEDGAHIVLLEHLRPDYVLAHEELVGHLDDLVFAVAVEDDDVVYLGAVAHKLVFLESGAHEAVAAVDVELLGGLDYLGGFDGVKVAYLSVAWMVGAIFLDDILIPVDGHVGHVGQVVLYLLELFLDTRQQFVGLVLAVFQDALHLDFEQTQQVVACDAAHQLLLEWSKLLVEELHHGVLVGSLLKAGLLVHAFLDEDALERDEEQLLEQLVAAYLQLHPQQVFGVLDRVGQHVADGEEAGFVVLDYAAVGRNVGLAVGEGIERVDGLVGACARRQMYQYLHLGGGIVVDAAYLDFTFLYSLGDAVYQS